MLDFIYWLSIEIRYTITDKNHFTQQCNVYFKCCNILLEDTIWGKLRILYVYNTFPILFIFLQYKLHDNFTIVSSARTLLCRCRKWHHNMNIFWAVEIQHIVIEFFTDMICSKARYLANLWATKWNVIHCILMKRGLISILTNLLFGVVRQMH